MDENKTLFSQFYFPETSRHEDSPKFRGRLLKSVEDLVNDSSLREEVYKECRSRMGLDINKATLHSHLYIEETFNELDIRDILDFISIVLDTFYSYCQNYKHENYLRNRAKNTLKSLIETVNNIFKEESMCYVLTELRTVRYYPDEEFHTLTKTTLAILGDPQYKIVNSQFNEVLDDIYKNHGKESPLVELFKCIETFVLTTIKSYDNEKSYNRLNEGALKSLFQIYTQVLTARYSEDDLKALECTKQQIAHWIKACHKYRHGKADQVNNNVPHDLFNHLLSSGISHFRFILEIDNNFKKNQGS